MLIKCLSSLLAVSEGFLTKLCPHSLPLMIFGTDLPDFFYALFICKTIRRVVMVDRFSLKRRFNLVVIVVGKSSSTT